MADPRPLSRDQLAKFLPDAEAVKRFERLFAVAGDLTPTDVSTLYRLAQEASIVADSSMAGVASALAQILELAQRSAINESTADSKATAALALASQLARQLEAALVAPPPAEPYLERIAALVAPPPAEPYLERMHDVRMLSPQDDDFIQYNSTNHQWENRPFSFGTAAYADLQTSATDATAGRVLSVGAFGLGGSVSLGLFDLNSAQVGSFIGVVGTEANAVTYNWPTTGVAGTTPVWYSVLTYGTTSRATQRAAWIFAGANQGRIFERVKHDATWSSWREIARFNTSGGLAVPGLLSSSGGLYVDGATSIPCQPLALYDLNNAINGGHITVYGIESDAVTYNWPTTGVAGATAVYWVVRTHGTSGRVIQRAVQIFAGANQGRIFERVKHDATWSSWRECPRLDASAGLTVSGILTAVGGLKTGLATALVTSTVAMNNGAAAATATLSNAPLAGNPTKWIPINDNGTTRYIPAW